MVFTIINALIVTIGCFVPLCWAIMIPVAIYREPRKCLIGFLDFFFLLFSCRGAGAAVVVLSASHYVSWLHWLEPRSAGSVWLFCLVTFPLAGAFAAAYLAWARWRKRLDGTPVYGKAKSAQDAPAALSPTSCARQLV